MLVLYFAACDCCGKPGPLGVDEILCPTCKPRKARPMFTIDPEAYWNIVIGPMRSAKDVCREFEIEPSNEELILSWLASAEYDAVKAGPLRYDGTDIEVPEAEAKAALAKHRAATANYIKNNAVDE